MTAVTLQGQFPPVRIDVFDKNMQFEFTLADFRSVSVVHRWGATTTGTVTVDVTHPRIGRLLALGERLTVDWFVGSTRADYADPAKWLRVLSGGFVAVNAVGPDGAGYVELSTSDDHNLLGRVLAWPDPTSAVGSQSVEYDVQSGPAETVVKHFIQANVVTRLGLPVVVAADQGRGSTLSVSARFDTLEDLLMDAAADAGVGMRFTQQSDGTVLMDCYVPTDRTTSVIFGEEYGNLSDWTLLRSDPTGTRAVVGGSGDGTSQTLVEVVDPLGEESLWGTVYEIYVEGTSTTTTATLTADGTTELTNTQATAGVSATALETPGCRFGVDYFTGDLVGVKTIGDLVVSERVVSTTLGWSSDEGVTVTPQLGDVNEAQEPNAAVAAAIARIAKAMRRGRTRP